VPALSDLCKDAMDVISLQSEQTLLVRRWRYESEVLAAFNFNDQTVEIKLSKDDRGWQTLLDSDDKRSNSVKTIAAGKHCSTLTTNAGSAVATTCRRAPRKLTPFISSLTRSSF
jgi:hypothetical protein